jgi:hypothetical protein
MSSHNATANHPLPRTLFASCHPTKVNPFNMLRDQPPIPYILTWKMLPFDCITLKRFQLCDLIQSRNCREVTFVSGIPVPAPIHTWIIQNVNPQRLTVYKSTYMVSVILLEQYEDSYTIWVLGKDYCREVAFNWSMLKLEWKNDELLLPRYFIYGILRPILLYQCMPNGFDDTHHLPLIKT